jgi:DNA modification methylase
METRKDSGQLEIIYSSPNLLVANERNARTHSKHQIRQIGNSISQFGFTNPVLVDNKNTIIAGHGRVAAARLLGIDQVPTIRLEALREDQIRAYVIADNRLAEMAGWDKSILAIELQHLVNLDSHLSLDAAVTGFEIPEIDVLLEEAKETKPDTEDILEIDEAALPITQTGDLWQLGKHRVLCANSLEPGSYKALLNSRSANVVFVDPPYNLIIDGNVAGHGAIRRREFMMASGEMDDAEFAAFLTQALALLARHSSSNSVHFVCMDWRHLGQLLAAGKQTYKSLLNVCVWVKDNGGLGSFYRSRHELVFVFQKGKGRFRNNIQLGRYGRYRSNVWQYPSTRVVSPRSEEGNLLTAHPTTKPVAMVVDALLDCSARGDIVLDSFLGSGTTLIAAERVGRICYGIEIDPLFVDVAIRRWQKHTGDFAIHAVTNKRFDEIAAVAEVNRG